MTATMEGSVQFAGELDRPALGQLIFNNPELRKKLMRATHYPIFVELIWQIFLSWLWCNHSVVIRLTSTPSPSDS